MSSRDELANELYRTGEQLDTCKEQRIKLVMQVVQLEDLCDAKDQEIKLCHQHIAELKAQAEEDERLGAQLEEVADERDKAEACLADFKHGMTQDHADLVNARHRIAELEERAELCNMLHVGVYVHDDLRAAAAKFRDATRAHCQTTELWPLWCDLDRALTLDNERSPE